MLTGFIDEAKDATVTGWLYSPFVKTMPIVLVDGKPASLVEWELARPDVCASLRMQQPTGFRFHAANLKAGSVVQLHAHDGRKLNLVCEHRVDPVWDSRSLNDPAQALRICRQQNAVAVVCWEGGHNPAGRAKVLYDIAASRHPCMLFTYLFPEFGGRVWPPIAEDDCHMFAIPWAERAQYHDLIGRSRIAFETVWLCKPRLPTFMLASQLAAPGAKLIIDLDDNEDHFAKSPHAHEKPYGAPSIGLSRALLDSLPSRTVASRTLQSEFGGEIVRHARDAGGTPKLARQAEGPKSLLFLGTVRPHKNVLSIAKAVNLYNYDTRRDVQFKVIGDIQPAGLIEELKAHGAETGGIVSSGQSRDAYEDCDVAITGFPSGEHQDENITRYQISAKIGDALAAGRPVLVPASPAVADLAAVPGVFLFDEMSFPSQLTAALQHQKPIRLPREFTIDGAYVAFAKARAGASAVSGSTMEMVRRMGSIEPYDRPRRPALLLLWKQLDSCIYGRRIDQVARSYKRRHPDHNVIVLELCHRQTYDDTIARRESYLSDSSLVAGMVDRKEATHVDADGVQYDLKIYENMAGMPVVFEQFLVRNNLTPANTVAIVFPIIPHFEKIAGRLCEFPVIVDFVDNQLGWSTSPERKVATHARYALAGLASKTHVFNSQANMSFFTEQCDAARHLIPNWYERPADARWSNERFSDGKFHLLYSGNMNDRLDWRQIEEVLDLDRDIQLHLVGSADRSAKQIERILARPNAAYYGPQREIFTLELASRVHLAIVPHVTNVISTFMNPLKMEMYRSVGLPSLAMKVPGIGGTDKLLRVCENREAFLRALGEYLVRWRQGELDARLVPAAGGSDWAAAYVTLIEGQRNGIAQAIASAGSPIPVAPTVSRLTISDLVISPPTRIEPETRVEPQASSRRLSAAAS